ncbi:hypothetical protein DAEQUDRAFT_416418 [Daedalea quercina L-15889]|uniref:Fungal-type protein kinase domain-containing protein n=1 Tax=Daedalea quercina L-15889 TaxID=1314783 RepID=A0A165TIP6_9APHY|nr:hypothetical protein DAEQUDRAFT_416418 [Daedalea quercina L-15889]
MSEIEDKINLVNEPLATFFRDYVPCNTPFSGKRPWTCPEDVFEKVPTTGRETTRYCESISGLESIVSEFNAQRRPKFIDGSKCAVPIPFKAWEHDSKYTLPDILMSFPGENGNNWAKTWQGIAMVFEVKPKEDEDPISKKGSPRVKPSALAKGVLVQLATSARNLMLTHGLLFMYVVGIYNRKARIYRFDHAACAVSRSFNMKSGAVWALHELLWRVCHYQAHVGGLVANPLMYMLLGADPTLERVSDKDVTLADGMLMDDGSEVQQEWYSRWSDKVLALSPSVSQPTPIFTLDDGVGSIQGRHLGALCGEGHMEAARARGRNVLIRKSGRCKSEVRSFRRAQERTMAKV